MEGHAPSEWLKHSKLKQNGDRMAQSVCTSMILIKVQNGNQKETKNHAKSLMNKYILGHAAQRWKYPYLSKESFDHGHPLFRVSNIHF